MLNLGAASASSISKGKLTTLWRCSKCEAFISINSVYRIDETFCPVCVEIPLEFCGSSVSAPEFQFADA